MTTQSTHQKPKGYFAKVVWTKDVPPPVPMDFHFFLTSKVDGAVTGPFTRIDDPALKNVDWDTVDTKVGSLVLPAPFGRVV
jgi:hypothetical protein